MSQKAQELFAAALGQEKEIQFEAARKTYQELVEHFPEHELAGSARSRLEDLEHLLEEKALYERIDENAKKVLTEIGMNIAESQPLMELLIEADAIDFDNSQSLWVPLKRDYLERCLELVPRQMPLDPGPNTFGTGATPPFLKRPDSDDLRAAEREEYREIVKVVAQNQDVVGIFSLPVAPSKRITGYEVAQIMEEGFSGLKMTATNKWADDEVAFLKGKDDWVDGTSLIVGLSPMNTMVEPFLRSARTGNNLLLLDLTIAGVTAPATPEGLLTQIHAQVLFMMVVAQTINPGLLCMHGGIPGVVESGGDLSYSSPHQPLINTAMARLNTWITKFPSAQSGGSTSLVDDMELAVRESQLSRNTMRKYGTHIVRHAFGAMGSLNFFSLEKFVADCEREREALAKFRQDSAQVGVLPMYLPADHEVMEGIREIAEKGNPRNADHTLRNVEAFDHWERAIIEATRKRNPYPDIEDTVTVKL